MSLTEEGIIEVPGMSSQWVRLGGGAKAHYMFAGETGPAVVLLHGGLPGSSGAAGWRYIAANLAENGFRVYCPDMPRSTGPRACTTTPTSSTSSRRPSASTSSTSPATPWDA